MDSNIEWYNNAKEKNIELFTCDLLPPELADVIIFLELPEKRSVINEIRKKAPHAKYILIIIESPLEPYYYDARNHNDFDYIITYNKELIDNKRYFHINIPCSHPPSILPDIPWEQRKNCIILNTNYYKGLKTGRTPLDYFTNLTEIKKKGWCFHLGAALKNESNFLYSNRRKFVKIASKKNKNFINIYGKGWDGQRHSWYYRFVPDKPYTTTAGMFEGEKLELLAQYKFVLAFENYKGDIGYISEKIFDSMFAGAVPIYLGEKNIKSYIPNNCYIDASQYKNYNELIEKIVNTNEKEWEGMRNSIKDFIHSKAIEPFLPKAYANTINSIILKCK